MSDVYLGLGANIGDRMTALSTALGMIDELDSTKVIAVSRAYETEPWGVADQPDYANAVAHVRTTLRADELLDALNDIEDALGRERGERFGARTIDIDILLFGDEEWDSERLTVPHPRLLEREFTVVPLLEIAPDVCLPDGSPVTQDSAIHGRITAALGELPGWEECTAMPSDRTTRDVETIDIDGQQWVEVASSASAGRIDRAPDFELLFLQTVLEAEGVPYAYDPYAPTENFNPWGLTRPIRLLVPVSYAERARRLVRAAIAAPLSPPEM